MHKAPTSAEMHAIRRLIQTSFSDCARAEVLANLLLAWWRPDDFGHFDLRSIWSLDVVTRSDVVSTIGYLALVERGLEKIGLEDDLEKIAAVWRTPRVSMIDVTSPKSSSDRNAAAER